uniref:Homeodomain protein HOMEZ n=1 Tax=Takifugu rubripes TaxID=31033 RepID=Q8JH79_TAKRU|nr:homeodomain protein HOMEZ [Takifugu rubripes]
MATYGEHNGRHGIFMGMKEYLEGRVPKRERKGKLELKGSSKNLCHSGSSSEANGSGAASFTTNHNSVVCLPLVSEGLKLVWTQSDQTRDLDSIPELVQAFNLFPYPSSREVSTLARVCALPLDKVKVWFMVQRIKYGISWSSEEIEETRRKLAVPELQDDDPETKEEVASNNGSYVELVIDDKDINEVEDTFPSVTPPKKKMHCESPDSYKPAKPITPCFSSTLPPPQDSYFYRPPVETPVSAAADITLDLSSQQHRHGRYKKSKAQLAALRKSFLRENWPAETELRRLQEETGLTRNDIRKWFSDSRYQLRVGRGSLAAAQNYSQHTAVASKQDQQLQPLSLTTQNNRHVNGAKAPEGARSNGIKNSHFFQAFLSNSLEAFGERVLDADSYESVEDLSNDGDSLKEEEQNDEPLQLTCKAEPDVPQESPDTQGAVGLLKQHFLRCQWPKSEDYTELVKLTGLPRADIIQWFGDTRYAVKNGQLRWVKGIRDQFLALAAEQSSGGFSNGSVPGTSARAAGSRKRRAQATPTRSDSPDIQPLVMYYHSTGLLQEKDLDALCKKSKMSYQQVRDWFAARESVQTKEETVAD